MIKEIALRKLANISKEADYLSDGVGNAYTNTQLDALDQATKARAERIMQGKLNPSLIGYTDKKRLVGKIRKNPSIVNKLKWIMSGVK